MQPLFAYIALIWKITITILTLILFVVFLVRGLYLFTVLGKHCLKSNRGFQYQQQARGIRNSFSPVCLLGLLFCLCGVLGHLAPVHRCARSVRCFVCAVSWATRLLFTCVPAWFVVLRVRCPWPLGSCSPVCPLGVLVCLCGVLGHLAPVHWCARSVRCFACAVSWATWLLLTGVPSQCVVLLVRCPGPLGSCSPVCPLRALPVCAMS